MKTLKTSDKTDLLTRKELIKVDLDCLKFNSYELNLHVLFRLLQIKLKYMKADASGKWEKIVEVKQGGLCLQVQSRLASQIRREWIQQNKFSTDYICPIPTCGNYDYYKINKLDPTDKSLEFTPDILRYFTYRESLLDFCIEKLQAITAQQKFWPEVRSDSLKLHAAE